MAGVLVAKLGELHDRPRMVARTPYGTWSGQPRAGRSSRCEYEWVNLHWSQNGTCMDGIAAQFMPEMRRHHRWANRADYLLQVVVPSGLDTRAALARLRSVCGFHLGTCVVDEILRRAVLEGLDVVDRRLHEPRTRGSASPRKCAASHRCSWPRGAGLSSGGGSTSSTSRPAPAMTPLFSASARSALLITGPRLVLTTKAVFFIWLSRLALTKFSVSGVSGQWQLKKSLSLKSVSRSTRGHPLHRRCLHVGVIGDDTHAESEAECGSCLADAADAHQAQRQVGQLDQRIVPVAPVVALGPAPCSHGVGVVGHMLREVQDMGKGHLRHRGRYHRWCTFAHVDVLSAGSRYIDDVVAGGQHADELELGQLVEGPRGRG